MALFPFFWTPLLFFTLAHDQFELPKLTFLALLLAPLSLHFFLEKPRIQVGPLLYAYAAFLASQAWASLPAHSLSWRTSLLGDYENFSGLATLFTFAFFFIFLVTVLNARLLDRILLFTSLAAWISAIYALAQHFGLDLVHWNPGSVNLSREFASLGNPNFLAAYLAMAIPLYLVRALGRTTPPAPGGIPLFAGGLVLIGLLAIGSTTLGFPLPAALVLALRALGLFLLSWGGLSLLGNPAPWAVLLNSLLMTTGLLVTQSRGGILALGAALGFLAWVHRDLLKGLGPFFRRLPLPVPLGSLVLLAIPAWFARDFGARLASSLAHPFQALALSRLSIWGPALKMAAAHPWTGTGLDTFKIAFPFYSGTDFNKIDGMFVSSRMAHNEFLQLAATTGLPGLSAYLLLLGAFLWTAWRVFPLLSGRDRWLFSGICASALAFQVQGLFSFGVAALDLLWVLCLAWAHRLHRDLARPSAPSVPFASLLRVLSVGVAVLAFFFPITRLAADLAFQRGNAASQLLSQAQDRMSPDEALSYSDFEMQQMERAVMECPLEVKYWLYLGLAYEERGRLERPREKEWTLSAERTYDRTLRMSPSNAYYHNNLGRAQASLGAMDPAYLEKAESSFHRSVELDPINPLFLINWSDALDRLQRQGESREALQRAFRIDAAFSGRLQCQRASELYQKGERDRAFGVLDDSIGIAPGDPILFYTRGLLLLDDHKKKAARADLERAKELSGTGERDPALANLDRLIEQTER